MNKKEQNTKIRNIAIIAHVDHGKTTLVDAIFYIFRPKDPCQLPWDYIRYSLVSSSAI